MNLSIKNKMQSIKYIKDLNLNVLPEKYFEKYDEEQITNFIKKYPAEFYAVRIKNVAMSSKHRLAVKAKEILNYCKDLSSFTINVSSYCYKNNQVLTGEIRIYDDMKIEYILSNVPGYSVRDCYNNPDYVGKSDIFDKRLTNINGINDIIDYILKNNLTNIIVEFTVFNCLLGKNKEKVVIWELRTDY